MDTTTDPRIPSRAETLEILRLMGSGEPVLMLTGDGDGYGTRWTFRGQQVQPAIARYLMGAGYLADIGATEFGARKLILTPAGTAFRDSGLRWWASLGHFRKLIVRILG
jgi:hypothetical protein